MICQIKDNFHCNMQAEKGNKTASARMTQEMAHEINVITNKNIKALQALYDTPPLCLFFVVAHVLA